MIGGGFLANVAGAVRDQYRLGLGLFLVAPVAVALVVVPEFAQHVAEIRLGMFDSRAAAHALADDPTRWAFGYAKLTGLVLAFLACARAAWGTLGGGRWYVVRTIAWPRLIVGAALFALIGSIAVPFDGHVSQPLLYALEVVGTVLSLPFLFVVLAGLFGDRETPWRTLLRSWSSTVLLLILMLTGFGAMQLLHVGNHLLAMGRPMPLVWLLMVWDALVVGALAALTGAAFAIAFDRVRRSAPASA